jgi:hypothetical protein
MIYSAQIAVEVSLRYGLSIFELQRAYPTCSYGPVVGLPLDVHHSAALKHHYLVQSFEIS